MAPLRLLVSEIHNVGGFFGGDTVSLAGTPWPSDGDEQAFTIDEAALTNITSRFALVPGMLLELDVDGATIGRARLLAANDPRVLRAALGPPALPSSLDAPLVVSYYCLSCNLWVAGAPETTGQCILCGTLVEASD